MTMACPLRSTGITPLHHYKETDSPPQLDSDDAAMTYERFICCGSVKAGGELLRSSPPLDGASVLSASRFEPLVPFPFASPSRFSRSIQVDHRHCRPAANETMLDWRRAVGTEVVHWLGANKPAYNLDPGFLEHLGLSPRAVIGPGARFLDFLFTGTPHRRRSPGGRDGAVASTMLRS